MNGAHVQPKYCPYCGEELSTDAIFCISCGRSLEPSRTPVPGEKPSNAWYLLPILLTWIGSVIGYFALKGRDKRMADRVAILGVVMIFVYILGAGAYYVIITQPRPTPTPPTLPSPTPIPMESPTPSPTLIYTTPTPKKIETSMKADRIEVEDEQICVILDQIERTDNIPEEVTNLFKGRTLLPARKGCDYLIIYLTVSNIKDVHVTKLICEGSCLIDDDGHHCRSIGWFIRGLKYRDPQDIRSERELTPGSTGILIYEIPIDKNPATLRLIYSYLQSWEDEEEKNGQLDFDILK